MNRPSQHTTDGILLARRDFHLGQAAAAKRQFERPSSTPQRNGQSGHPLDFRHHAALRKSSVSSTHDLNFITDREKRIQKTPAFSPSFPFLLIPSEFKKTNTNHH
jgi:hypothetical protein